MDFRKGSLTCPITGIVGTPTDAAIEKEEKGLCLGGHVSTTKLNLSSDFVITTNNTVEWWTRFYAEDFQGLCGHDTDAFAYIRHGNGTGEWYDNIIVESDTNGDIGVITIVGGIQPGWNHFVLVYDPSADLTLYVNSVVQTDVEPMIDDITINKLMASRTADNLNGFLGAFIVYEGTATQTDVNRLYQDYLKIQPVKREIEESLSYPKPVVGTGLIAAYNMIPNGSTLVDISDNGNNGTLYKAVSTPDGLKFNGSTDYVTMGDVSIFDGLTTFTVLLRFKSTSTGTANYLISQAFNGRTFYIQLNNNKLLGRVTGSSTITSADDFNDDQWHNIALVLNGATLFLYADGIDIGSISDATALVVTDDDNIILGGRGDDAAKQDYCNGEIADIKLYNYAFSEQEAQDYHNQFAKEVEHKDRLALDFGVGSTI